MNVNNPATPLYETYEINGIFGINGTNGRVFNSPNSLNSPNNVINPCYGEDGTIGEKRESQDGRNSPLRNPASSLPYAPGEHGIPGGIPSPAMSRGKSRFPWTFRRQSQVASPGQFRRYSFIFNTLSLDGARHA
jgi:hypothetical protein